MAEVSVSKAARMTGKGRSTIQRHMKEGKLSAGSDAAGNPVIDVSELIRVYGSIKADEADKSEPIKQHEAPRIESDLSVIEALREELKAARDREEAARDREEWLRKQLEAEQARSRELELRMLPPGQEEAPKKSFFARVFGR